MAGRENVEDIVSNILKRDKWFASRLISMVQNTGSTA